MGKNADPAYALMSSQDLERIARAYGGLAFLGAVPDSPAEKELRRGDIVLSVNGVPTPDVDSFVRARGLRDKSATVVYVRSGVEKTVELAWD